MTMSGLEAPFRCSGTIDKGATTSNIESKERSRKAFTRPFQSCVFWAAGADAGCSMRIPPSPLNLQFCHTPVQDRACLHFDRVFAAVILQECKHVNLAIAFCSAGTSCPCVIRLLCHALVHPWLAGYISFAGVQPGSPALQLQ